MNSQRKAETKLANPKTRENGVEIEDKIPPAIIAKMAGRVGLKKS
jgi:hypothetical protein